MWCCCQRWTVAWRAPATLTAWRCCRKSWGWGSCKRWNLSNRGLAISMNSQVNAGQVNAGRVNAAGFHGAGFHGAAILSDLTLQAPALIRLERPGECFGPDRHEPRVGSTIALLAFVAVAGEPVLMVNVHLESHCAPVTRAVDMCNLLRLGLTCAPDGLLRADPGEQAVRPRKSGWSRHEAARWRRAVLP